MKNKIKNIIYLEELFPLNISWSDGKDYELPLPFALVGEVYDYDGPNPERSGEYIVVRIKLESYLCRYKAVQVNRVSVTMKKVRTGALTNYSKTFPFKRSISKARLGTAVD